ncbi:MAG: hypothetical protein ACYTEQ_13720 [Planctomycetota bacterium]
MKSLDNRLPPPHNEIMPFRALTDADPATYTVKPPAALPLILMELNTSPGTKETCIYATGRIIARHAATTPPTDARLRIIWQGNCQRT